MSQQAWFEHFKEQLQGLTESYEQSGSPLSLLAYCLQENRLSVEKYLRWAMTHYRMPQIRSSFFSETPISQEMFAKWATHYPWSTECLPVAEWDGSLIIACLQPPQDFPQYPASGFVLAQPADLEKAWKSLHATPEIQADTQSQKTEEAPEGLNLQVTVPKSASSDQGFSLEDLGEIAQGKTASSSDKELSLDAEQAADEGALEGLFDGPTVVSLQPLSEAFSSNPTTENSDATADSASTAPEDILVLNSSDNLSVSSEATMVQNTDSSNEATVVVPQESVAAKASAIAEKASEKSESKPNIPPPPQSSFPPPFEDSFGNKPIPIMPRPAGAAKPNMNPVASAHFTLEKIKKKNAQVVSEKIKSTLSEMKTHFEKSMILTLDDAESQLTAFAWDENFKDMKDTSLRIPLKTPSIFNIVASTQKPFHGYISLNEINEKFFDGWNSGIIPDHVTITPLLIADKMVGMILGIADKSAYNKVSLSLAEKLSNEFIKGLQAA